MSPAVVPAATYRLQFNTAFTFDDATARRRLPRSPRHFALLCVELLQGGPGQHARLRRRRSDAAESGDRRRDSYDRWIGTLRAHRHGPHPRPGAEPHGHRAVGEPVVAGRARERPELAVRAVLRHRLASAEARARRQGAAPDSRRSVRRGARAAGDHARVRDGAFRARYYDTVLPIAPDTYDRILGIDADALLAEHRREPTTASSSTASSPPSGTCPARDAQTPELRAERDREKEVVKRRLAALTTASPARARAHSSARSRALNGDGRQAAQLRPPRRAAERAVVSARALARRLRGDQLPPVLRHQRARGAADGRSRRSSNGRTRSPSSCCATAHRRLRIDHVDGLYDPGDYLHRLQARAREVRPDLFSDDRRLYLVVEKILGPTSSCRRGRSTARPATSSSSASTACSSTAATSARSTTRSSASRGCATPFREIRLPQQAADSSHEHVERHQLARAPAESLLRAEPPLPRLHAQQPDYAMREIIACFPVYRTYVNEREPTSATHDRRYIEHAVSAAKRRNPRHPAVVFDFVRGCC